MLTHASLMHNLHIFQDCTKCDRNMTAVCFLPHFHAMGLICHYLFVPFCGGTSYFMSPAMFVNSPSLWIEALSKFRGTFCMAPNFALDLAVVATDEVPRDIDLSSLHFLSNGSESVSIDTMRRFQSKFAPRGLRQNVLRAFYGLSEHTVHLCASAEEDLIVESKRVGHGRPHSSVAVKVVNPRTCMEMTEGREGGIWVHSESKALGYWGKEKLSKETFHAELVGDKEKTYLRTGDMGFLRSGSVFVTGPRENLIIVSGRQIYLNDIENRLEMIFSELRPGRTVAVVWDSTLALAPFLEGYGVSPTQSQAPRRGVGFFAELQNEDYLQAADCHVLAEKIASRIGIDFRVETLLVALLPLKTMPHTGSGKRQRPLCKANLLGGTLQVIYQWSPSTMLSGKETVKPEFIPLPPTPIPTTKTTKKTKPTVAELGDKHRAPEESSSAQKSSDIPSLTLDGSPVEEDVAAIPRKESRFCLEDAPPILKESGTSLETLAEASRKACVDHMDAPDAARREKSKGLIRQERTVIDIISKVLQVTIDMDTNIWTRGCDSAKASQISSQLEQHLGFSVEAHLLFAYQTPRALLEKLKRTLLHLCSPVSAKHTSSADASQRTAPPSYSSVCLPSRKRDIAIVSMACKFPGCNSPEELWELLREKAVPISHFRDPASGKWIHGAFTDSMACFDHKWFGISKMEASKMDPQQSILLHTAWECLRRSGYRSPDEVKGSETGVFIGFWGSDARALNLATENHPPCTSYIGSLTANRISYVFDLKGPSMAIDTACAASLSALEVAFSYIQQGKCSQALVGGVNALLDPRIFHLSSSMGVLSPKGEPRVFDIEASGYVRGEGCGMIMVKRVRDALRDNNRLLAVVKSIETLHNGDSATLTAPNKHAQSRLIHTSLSSAAMGPSDVSYMEAHGTGTPLGDPMEMSAIQDTFRRSDASETQRVGPLIVGSMKANIGHLEAGSGIAGVIKTVMVLEHAKAPGNPGLKTINPSLNIDPDQILLPREMVSLDKYYMYSMESSNLLCAGVNSYGIGGAIATAVLQQYSQLPHLGQVKCSLILGGEFGDLTGDQVMGIIQLLRARLWSFNSAYLACVEAFQRAVKPVKVLASEAYYHHPAYLMFCLLYSLARTLQAHNIELSFVMGTNLCAEVVVLAISETLILSDAMRLLLAGMAPQVFNIKFIIEEEMQPTVSFLSPTLNQLCLPGKFPPASLNQLIQDIQRSHLMQCTCSDPALATRLVSIARGGYGSLLAITLHPKSTVMKAVRRISESVSLLQLHSPGLIDHIRETCLQLRRTSDKMASKDCEKPAADAPMPGFYERYPMRAQHRANTVRDDTQGDGNLDDTNRAPTKFHSTKPKQRLSCADESGYITQATSAESLKSSTPAISPIKSHPPPTAPMLMEMSERHETALSEQAIINGMLDLIRNELVVDLVQTDKEAEEIGLLALGVDSISLIELQDHLLQAWKVDLPLARITELDTVKAIAAEVARKCKCEQPSKSVDNDVQQKALPLSQKGHYYTIPPMEELGRLSKDELKRIPNFTVGRADYGKVEFLGKTDISQLDLQRQLVRIDHCSISLCEIGKYSLNRPALLFYENIFSPRDGSAVEDPVSELLKSLSVSASLVHSDPVDGQLVMKVDGFY